MDHVCQYLLIANQTAAVHHLVDWLVPRMLALRLVIVAITTAYVLYLLRLHHARIGNIVSPAPRTCNLPTQ